MYWTSIRLTLLFMGLVFGGMAFSQVESFEPKLGDSDPFSGKDPMLDSSLTGLGALQSPDVLSSTTTLILPPSLSTRRDSRRAIPGGQVEDATSGERVPGSGERTPRAWEETLRTTGSMYRDRDLQSHLPARREQATSQGLLLITSPSGTPPMGWNGLSPIAPGQSMILVPATAPAVSALKDTPTPKASHVTDKDLLGSHDLGSSLRRNESSDPSQPVSSKLASQKTRDSRREKPPLLEKTQAKPLSLGALEGGAGFVMPSKPRAALGNTASSRLQSQMLTSSGGGLASQSRTSSTLPRSSSIAGSGAAQTPTLPSKRFHGATPGEPRRPDYTYQYQGTRRYSVGETEYGRGNSYEALPYYRRKR